MNFKNESELQNFIHSVVGGDREVTFGSGKRIDILTPSYGIEVKPKLTRNSIYQAMGQLRAYKRFVGSRKLVIAGLMPSDEKSSLSTAREASQDGIDVWYIDRMPRFQQAWNGTVAVRPKVTQGTREQLAYQRLVAANRIKADAEQSLIEAQIERDRQLRRQRSAENFSKVCQSVYLWLKQWPRKVNAKGLKIAVMSFSFTLAAGMSLHQHGVLVSPPKPPTPAPTGYTNLYKEPSATSPLAAVLKNGTSLTAELCQGDWVKTDRGWVEKVKLSDEVCN